MLFDDIELSIVIIYSTFLRAWVVWRRRNGSNRILLTCCSGVMWDARHCQRLGLLEKPANERTKNKDFPIRHFLYFIFCLRSFYNRRGSELFGLVRELGFDIRG